MRVWSLLMVFGLSSAVAARPVVVAESPAGAADVTPLPPAALQVRRAMDRAVPAMRLESIGLEDFLKLLAERTGAGLRVDWAALGSAGVERDWAVIVRPNGKLSAARLLDLALGDAAPAGGPPLAWVLTDDGVIDVSTREDVLRRHTVVRVYDLRPPPSHPAEPSQSARQAERTDAIAKIIRETVDPESWASDPTAASLRVRDGQLIITQTVDNHRRIQALVEQLRETVADAPAPAAYSAPPAK